MTVLDFYKNIVFLLLVTANIVFAGTDVSPDNQFSEKFKPLKNSPISIAPLDYLNNDFKIGEESASNQLLKQLANTNNKTKIVSDIVYKQLWESFEAELGGLYSSQTGEFDFKKYMLYLSYISRSVCAADKSDYVLFPSFVIKKAELKYDRARWDGVSYRVPVKGDIVTRSGDRRAFNFSGTTSALSLELMLFDKNGDWFATTYGAIGLPYYYYIQNVRDKDQSIEFNDKVFSKKGVRSGVKSSVLPLIDSDYQEK